MATTRKTTAKAAAVKKTAEPLKAAVTAGKEAAETTAETIVETQAKPVEKAAPVAKKPAPKAAKPVFPGFQAPSFQFPGFQAPSFQAPSLEGYGEFAEAGKENVEAFVKSGNLLAKGMETLGKEMMDFARLSIEGNVAATKAVMGAKSFKEAVDLQTDFAKKNVDQMLNEGARLAELSVKVTNEAMEPIQARVNVTVKTIMKPIAA